jgi:uncharacterized membrane protein
LFKIDIQAVSLSHFHVYKYYNPNLFNPSIFLLSTLVPFHGDFSSFKNSVFILYVESTSTMFTFLTYFFCLPSLLCDFPLLFTISLIFILVLYFTYERKHGFYLFVFWT